MLDALLSMALAALLALAPTLLLLRRAPAAIGRREASLAIQRLRLREVERDREEGLIGEAERDAARLEIQRRILFEAERTDAAADDATEVRSRRFPIVLTLVAVPVLAAILYGVGGHPSLPAQPIEARLRAEAANDLRDAAIIAELRSDLAALPMGSTKRREGDLLLGEAEAAHEDWAPAADAFAAALADGAFDPTIAVEAAEARTRADGRVSPGSAALFKRAIASGPPDASWRTLAEERIAESEHAH